MLLIIVYQNQAKTSIDKNWWGMNFSSFRLHEFGAMFGGGLMLRQNLILN